MHFAGQGRVISIGFMLGGSVIPAAVFSESLLRLYPVKSCFVLFGHLHAVVVCPCVEAAFLKGKTREEDRFCASLWSGVSSQPERTDWRNFLFSTEIPKTRISYAKVCTCVHAYVHVIEAARQTRHSFPSCKLRSQH